MKRINKGKKSESGRGSLISIVVSLFLVAVAVGIAAGVRLYVRNKTYTGPETESVIESTESSEAEGEYLFIDENFEECYIMIYDVPSTGVWANLIPGVKTNESVELENGQIVQATECSTYENQMYYLLENGLYLDADASHAEPLASYTELEGYLAITYISSTGVKLRSWADFDADNVVGTVYVGNKVQVTAKVELMGGTSAYITDEGYYITTDTRYYNDYTSVPGEEDDSSSEEDVVESTDDMDSTQPE
ncbi:MAG: hypothetical protein LUF92_00840 [Clostridiales bacterium]|nr:hypothetical protein [Clostridiales bacterium]